jgi:hypothetical protein
VEHVNEAVPLEQAQRLAERRAADGEALGELVLARHLLAGLQIARPDRLGDPIAHLYGQRAPVAVNKSPHDV